MEANPTSRYRLRLADQVLALPVPGALVIGRGTECDVALADPAISRKHARVVAHADGRVFVEDLGSVLGLTVNGALVRESKELAHGDRVGIGSKTLVLVDAAIRRLPTRPTPSDPTRPSSDSAMQKSGPGATRQMGPSTDTVTLEHALEAGERTLAETIATRAVTGMTRGSMDVVTLSRLERSLAKLGETDSFWLDRILDLRAAHGSVPDAAIVTRMHTLARTGRACTPEVLQRYLDAIGKRKDLPTADQVLYRRMQSLARASSDG